MFKKIENANLKDFIHVEKNLIPKNICELVIDKISNHEKWQKHSWYNNKDNKVSSYSEKELDILFIQCEKELEEYLNIFVSKSIKLYDEFLNQENSSGVCRFSPIRFNRYKEGNIMRKHSDHIYSIFDGECRGIPILSIILNFNEDYEGGNLIFWDDYKIKLGTGDVVIFPSLFLFPHRVTEVTKDIRYSGVCWGF